MSFKISGSQLGYLGREVIGGLTTFVTMAYIIVVNPAILSTSGTGMSHSGVMTATILLASSMSILMGVYARLPYAVAPGMGINAFFTYTLIIGQGIPWPTALGLVFWAGVLFLLMSILPIRTRIANAIPRNLRHGCAVGIGIFLTFIGLKNVGLVVAHPVTLVTIGQISVTALLGVLGVFLIVILLRFRIKAAFLCGIIAITLAAWWLGKVQFPNQIFSAPDFESVLFKLDIWDALQLAFLPAIIAIFLTDLFDSISTFVGVAHATRLFDANGKPKNMKQGLIVDAMATLSAGIFGTSAGTAYIESTAGIESGARSGLSAVVAGLCFLPFLFLSPLVSIVPDYATAPVLILVGALMFKSVTQISTASWEEFLPAFLTVILIPLTFSITQGVLWGIMSHVILYVLAGRAKELDPTLYVIAGVAGFLTWLH